MAPRYRFTAKEARNTGLPRFDRLLAKGTRGPGVGAHARDRRPDLAPVPDHAARDRRRRSGSWRICTGDRRTRWPGPPCCDPGDRGGARRGAAGASGSCRTRTCSRSSQDMDLPAHVERAVVHRTTDVQGLYRAVRAAGHRLLVGRVQRRLPGSAGRVLPVRPRRRLGGAHIGRKGYFEYERDGFGPVALTRTRRRSRRSSPPSRTGPRPLARLPGADRPDLRHAGRPRVRARRRGDRGAESPVSCAGGGGTGRARVGEAIRRGGRSPRSRA